MVSVLVMSSLSDVEAGVNDGGKNIYEGSGLKLARLDFWNERGRS